MTWTQSLYAAQRGCPTVGNTPKNPGLQRLVIEAALPPAATDAPPPTGQRRKGETKEAILTSLSAVPRHLQEIHQHVQQGGKDLTYKHVRTQVWQFTQGDKPLAESPKSGYYQLTPAGVEHVNKLKVEDPAVTGSSSATKS